MTRKIGVEISLTTFLIIGIMLVIFFLSLPVNVANGNQATVIEGTTQISICGNNTKEGGEECDGPDFGGATCTSEGFDGGTLSCNPDCTLNVSQCFADPTPPSTPRSPSQFITPTMDTDASQPEMPGSTVTERMRETLDNIIEKIMEILRRAEDIGREDVIEEQPIRDPGIVDEEDIEDELEPIEEIEDEEMEEVEEEIEISFINKIIKTITEEIREKGVMSWPVVSLLIILLISIMVIYTRL